MFGSLMKRIPHLPVECSCSPPHRNQRSPHSRWPVTKSGHLKHQAQCDWLWHSFSKMSQWSNLPGSGHSFHNLSFDQRTLCQSHYRHRPPACSFGHQTVTKQKKRQIKIYDFRYILVLFMKGMLSHTSSINLAWPCRSMGLMAFCSKPTEPGYSILLPNEWAMRKLGS